MRPIVPASFFAQYCANVCGDTPCRTGLSCDRESVKARVQVCMHDRLVGQRRRRLGILAGISLPPPAGLAAGAKQLSAPAPLFSSLFGRTLVHQDVVLGSVDDQVAGKTAFDTRQRVIDQNVVAAAVDLEVHYRRAARCHRHRLDILQRR